MEDITAIIICFIVLLVCFRCQGCMEDERDALLKIKRSINFPEGNAFSNWYGKECCNWEGIECDVNTMRISMIYIMHKRDPSLSKNWYPYASLFSQFKDLRELQLPGNHIGGFSSTHELNKLKHLQTLDLRDNAIANGSHICWGKLPSLSYLYLSNNKLQGNLPNCLCENPSITELYLSGNKFEGNIPACLGNMTSPKCLDLSNNEFNGSFPSLLIRNLTSIEHLALSRNEFRDRVSLSIFVNLSRLEYLDISYNSPLELELDSPSWFPSFSLNVLKLAGCKLKSIPRFLSKQQHLVSLDLSYNLLVGNIPSWLLYNVTLELWIGGNNWSSLFPKTFPNISSQIIVLDISNNILRGPLPKEIDQSFSQLRYLDVSSNSFNGNLPQSLGKMIQLEHLDISDNEFLGDAIPSNSSLPNLRLLYLDWNDFSGTFPDSLCRSKDLQIVDMQNNGLSGELSSYLPALPQIKILLLGGNEFVGSIPLQLCHMTNLRLLDLSRNNLSGGIPTCLDNITSWTQGTPHILNTTGKYLYMWGIDISCNRLTGEFPIQVTHLVKMITLNISHNLLAGPIHKSFGNLTALESINLSHNCLFGELSPQLTALVYLEIFNVSFNNLSGSVPIINQFSTFDESSYLGNPGLCGPPLTREYHHDSVEKSSSFFSNTPTVYKLLVWFVAYHLYSQ